MNIRVKTFAVLKNYLQDEFSVELENGSKVVDLIEYLEKLNPKANHILSHSLFAIQEEMIDKTTVVREGDLVCILPPVSGG